MKITILSHNLTSNAAMRAHRLGLAAQHFAEVTMLGPVKHRGTWGALPAEPWIKPVESKNLPKFFHTIVELIRASKADVIIAAKPYLASYGVGLLAGECHGITISRCQWWNIDNYGADIEGTETHDPPVWT